MTRKRIGLALFMCVVFALTGLWAGGTQESSENAETSWAEEVGLHDQVPADELYEAAKAEGKVVIYSMCPAG